MESRPNLRFGDFTFDPATGDVLGPRGTRRLQPQPAAVLALLAGRAGELVTREELQARIWPDTKVEFDQGINYCIRQIRAALDERAGEVRFVETLPRRGYRFVAAVSADPDAGAPPAVPPVRRPRAAVAAGVVVSLTAAAALAAAWAGRADVPTATLATPAPRIVVLPFETPATADEGRVSFERALADALVLELTAAGVGEVAIVGPLTTEPLVRGGATAAEIGDRLAADYVVSGHPGPSDSILFLQAIRRADGAHLFARRFPVGGRTAEALGAEMSAALLATLVRAPGSGN